jgi:hypothetical protein
MLLNIEENKDDASDDTSSADKDGAEDKRKRTQTQGNHFFMQFILLSPSA